MAEEQFTEAIVTSVAEQITITEYQPDFAGQQEIIAQHNFSFLIKKGLI